MNATNLKKKPIERLFKEVRQMLKPPFAFELIKQTMSFIHTVRLVQGTFDVLTVHSKDSNLAEEIIAQTIVASINN